MDSWKQDSDLLFTSLILPFLSCYAISAFHSVQNPSLHANLPYMWKQSAPLKRNLLSKGPLWVACTKDAIGILFPALQFLGLSLLFAEQRAFYILHSLHLHCKPSTGFVDVLSLTLSSTRTIIPTNSSYNSEQIFCLLSLSLSPVTAPLFPFTLLTQVYISLSFLIALRNDRANLPL